MKFTELNLPKYIMGGLEKQGFESPTEIQEKCIPSIMSGEDVIGKSETGSGKTYAYGIPAIIGTKTEENGVNVIVVCPTRELASQVCDEMRKLTDLKKGCKLSLIVGGNSFERQLATLKIGSTKIVIGTPGRIMDHLRRKTLKLDKINLVILDEADEMLNMGFKEDIETILKSTNPQHQTVMFSATMPKPILALTKNFMKDPKLVELSRGNDTSKLIKQYYVNVEDRKTAMQNLLVTFKPNLSIVFCNTKRGVDDITKYLNGLGFSALALHGDMRQNARKEAMLEFKNMESNILVATDVAARGIDVKNVDIIFNYDVPNDIEYYIHRIGRTGRAGKTGVAITLVNSRQQRSKIDAICKETHAVMEEYKIEGMETFSPTRIDRKPGTRSSSFGSRRPETSRFGARSSEGRSERSSFGSRRPERKFDRPSTDVRAPKFSGERTSLVRTKATEDEKETPSEIRKESSFSKFSHGKDFGGLRKDKRASKFGGDRRSFSKPSGASSERGTDRKFGGDRKFEKSTDRPVRSFSKPVDGEKTSEDRPVRSSNDRRSYSHAGSSDRPVRRFSKPAEGTRTSEDRPARRFSRSDDRKPSSFAGSAERPARRFEKSSDDRKPSSFAGSAERPRRAFNKSSDSRKPSETGSEIKRPKRDFGKSFGSKDSGKKF